MSPTGSFYGTKGYRGKMDCLLYNRRDVSVSLYITVGWGVLIQFVKELSVIITLFG